MAIDVNSTLLLLLSLIFSTNKNYNKSKISNDDPPSANPGQFAANTNGSSPGGLGNLLSKIPSMLFGSGNSSSDPASPSSKSGGAPFNAAGLINPLLSGLKPGGNPGSNSGGGSSSQGNPASLLNGIKLPSGSGSGNSSGSSGSKSSGSSGGGKGGDNPLAGIINPILNGLKPGGNPGSSSTGGSSSQNNPLSLLNGIKLPTGSSPGNSSGSSGSSSGGGKGGDNPLAGIINPLLGNLSKSGSSTGSPSGSQVNPMDLLKGIKIPTGGSSGSSPGGGGGTSLDPLGLLNSLMSSGGTPSASSTSQPGAVSSPLSAALPNGTSPGGTALKANSPKSSEGITGTISSTPAADNLAGSNGIKWNSFSEDSPGIVNSIRPEDILIPKPDKIAGSEPLEKLPSSEVKSLLPSDEETDTKKLLPASNISSEIKSLPAPSDETEIEKPLTVTDGQVIYLPPPTQKVHADNSYETTDSNGASEDNESKEIMDFHSLGKELLESTVSIEEKLSPFLNEEINRFESIIKLLNDKIENDDSKNIVSILVNLNTDMKNTLFLLSNINSNIVKLVSLGTKFMDTDYTDIINLTKSVNETSYTEKNKLE